MKLSDLVDYLNQLDAADYDKSCYAAMRGLDAIMHTIDSHTSSLDDWNTNLSDLRRQIDQSIDSFTGKIEDLKSHIRSKIKQIEPQYYQRSSDLWEHEMYYETAEYILNRKLSIDSDSNVLLRSAIRNYGDWRVPGLIIRPGLENFIEDMVPLDPLYIVDQSKDLMHPAVTKFTPEYQRRLRLYEVNDYRDQEALQQLPDGQFGFVFAYNYFNYRPMEVIDRYLRAVFKKLRPGGVFFMTFNNCDRAHGVALVERSFMCYTPATELIRRAESYGLEVGNQYTGQADVSWLELRKPGTITSLRGGQTLAKIIPK